VATAIHPPERCLLKFTSLILHGAEMLRSFFKKAPKKEPSGDNASENTLLVTMLEVPEEDHEEIIDTISRKFSARFRVIFLVSTDKFDPLLAHNASWEYFISLEDQRQYRDLMDWADYLVEKWNLLLIKWKPARVIAYGTNVDRFLRHSREIRKITPNETEI
jgi:hypothetical protein